MVTMFSFVKKHCKNKTNQISSNMIKQYINNRISNIVLIIKYKFSNISNMYIKTHNIFI